ncbi:replication factor C subunit 3 [Striga asiatica]|uniref:Replication factor C subunit 3 n=1 Tax=Striga asiatica TaxID=4170 RepID=A0A5A7R0S1_STRAF|nr:replication factor C subunit 3 [Striga asiatica]
MEFIYTRVEPARRTRSVSFVIRSLILEVGGGIKLFAAVLFAKVWIAYDINSIPSSNGQDIGTRDHSRAFGLYLRLDLVDYFKFSNGVLIGRRGLLSRESRCVTEQDCPQLLFYGPSGSVEKTLIMARLRQIFCPNVEKVKMENKNWKIDAGSRTIDVELTTLSSTHYIELRPSDAGLQDCYVFFLISPFDPVNGFIFPILTIAFAKSMANAVVGDNMFSGARVTVVQFLVRVKEPLVVKEVNLPASNGARLLSFDPEADGHMDFRLFANVVSTLLSLYMWARKLTHLACPIRVTRSWTESPCALKFMIRVVRFDCGEGRPEGRLLFAKLNGNGQDIGTRDHARALFLHSFLDVVNDIISSEGVFVGARVLLSLESRREAPIRAWFLIARATTFLTISVRLGQAIE